MLCDLESDLINGSDIIKTRCKECEDNECYKWYNSGDMLPNRYAWNYQALGNRSASFMLDKSNEDIYLNCTSKQFKDEECPAVPSPENQDAVAGYMMSKYFKKYYCSTHAGSHLDPDGSNKNVWGAVAAAWYAGERHADLPQNQRSNSPIYYGTSSEPFPSIRQYIKKIMDDYHDIWSSHNSQIESREQRPLPGSNAPARPTQKPVPEDDQGHIDPNCFEIINGERKRCEGSERIDRVRALLKMSGRRTEDISNTHSLGQILYTDYIHIFQISGMILLIAMIGAIVLTFRQREGVKKQSYIKQISRERSEGIEVLEVSSNKGVKIDD